MQHKQHEYWSECPDVDHPGEQIELKLKNKHLYNLVFEEFHHGPKFLFLSIVPRYINFEAFSDVLHVICEHLTAAKMLC
jgi:hypothetical protein